MIKNTKWIFWGILFAMIAFSGPAGGKITCGVSSPGLFRQGVWYLYYDGYCVSDWLYQCEKKNTIRTLIFDPSADKRVIGYKLYYGQSGKFDFVVDLGSNTSYDFYDLEEGATYYIAASSYDRYGNESSLSNVIVYTFSECIGYFGLPTDFPISGDWTNTGTAKIGVYRPSTGIWYLDNDDGIWGGCETDICKGPFGGPGDFPVSGDWTNTGTVKIGVYRPSTGIWYLDNDDGIWGGCETDICKGPFGGPGDFPVVGDWTNAGTAKIGVYRPSTGTWYLDNGDGIWGGCGIDLCIKDFGLPGDLPVAGVW